jgi:23S rRNA-/tRNA-specific pseudouridylate synthase
MVVHPAAGNWDGTVVNALSYYLMNESPFGAGEFFGAVNNDDNDNYLFDDLDDDNMDDDMDDTINQNDAVTNSISSLRPGIVHRLDKGTTGKNCIQS